MSLTQRLRGAIIARTYAPHLAPGQKALDAGCGNGEVSAVLRDRLGLDIHGADIGDYRVQPIPFTRQISPDALPFPDAAFDVVMLNDVLHHVADPRPLVREAGRAGKTVFVFEDVESALLRFIDVHLNRRYWKDMPCPLSFRTPDEWTGLFAGLGFAVRTYPVTTPFWYPFGHQFFILTPKAQAA